MKYDFDTILNRYNTGSTKWDEMLKYGITPEMQIMPMSNAEMEFYNPPEVMEGLRKYLDEAVLAYFKPLDSYYDAVIGWMKNRHHWNIKREWIVPYPGVHGALCAMLGAYTRPGDGVIMMPPTWPGFFHVLEDYGCVRVDNPLIQAGNTYNIDFEDLEEKARNPKNKLLFFCSPQNPTGCVWTRDELLRVADICLRNDVLIISDELHSDLIMPGYTHIPMASLSPEISMNTISCTAPSKTFNLAGMYVSNIIIENEALRDRFNKIRAKYGIFRPNILAMKACEIAYAECAPWLDACIRKLDQNRRLVEAFLKEKLPMLHVTRLEGSYLMWIDMRALGLPVEELERALMEDAHVFFDDGYYFGDEGRGFQRVNIACPTESVMTALERLHNWILSLKADS